MKKLTNLQVSEFLKDYKEQSEIVILEKGKEKNELIESAKKRGIILSKNDLDLGVLKTIFLFTDKPNSNKCIVPSKEFVRVFPKIIGRPMNINHERSRVVGFYVDYKYIAQEKKAITYAIFFKSAYPEEWAHAKELQKKGKLSSSFEIWSPKSKRKVLSNGNYELHDMTPAGGALIFEENDMQPAFKDAKVLSIAKKQVESCMDEKCLILASKMKSDEIIVADQFLEEIKENVKKIQEEKLPPKLKCLNCEHEFSVVIPVPGENKCPKCFAIINENGEMIYPPQIIDFNLLCPACKIKNWKILEKAENIEKVKCMSCAKEFQLTFSESEDPAMKELLSKLMFIYEGSVSCGQCGTVIKFSQPSGITQKNITCTKCGLSFSVDITSKQFQKISNIEEIIDNKVVKSAKEGGQEEMEFKLDIGKYHRYYEGDLDKFNEDLQKSYDETKEPELAKRLTYQERKDLSDNMFAINFRVKNKETNKIEKVRMFPIQDKAHVESALARLGQDAPKATLKRLGVSIKAVKAKILRRAKQLKMTDLLERQKDSTKPQPIAESVVSKKEKLYKAGIKKLADKIITTEKDHKEEIENYQKVIMEYEKELALIYEQKDKELTKANSEINFYKDNAKNIHARREELGEYADDLSDVDILNEDKYELAKARKENDNLSSTKIVTASENVGDVVRDEGYYARIRKQVDDIAFGRNKKEN